MLTRPARGRARHRVSHEPDRELRAGRDGRGSGQSRTAARSRRVQWNYSSARSRVSAPRSSSACSSSSCSRAASTRRARLRRLPRSGSRQALLGLSFFLPRWVGQTDNVTLPSELGWSFHLNTTTFTGNQILVMLVVPCVLVALMCFFRFSVIGTALRAGAESADRAGTLGIPVAPAAKRAVGDRRRPRVHHDLLAHRRVRRLPHPGAESERAARRARRGCHRPHGTPAHDGRLRDRARRGLRVRVLRLGLRRGAPGSHHDDHRDRTARAGTRTRAVEPVAERGDLDVAIDARGPADPGRTPPRAPCRRRAGGRHRARSRSPHSACRCSCPRTGCSRPRRC